MQPRFIGVVDFAPQDPATPEMWQLECPFAQLTSDGYMIICRPWRKTDGASIPEPLWPFLGHPFEGGNKFWSQPHDQGYHGEAVVFRMADLPDLAPDELLEHYALDRYVYGTLLQFRVSRSRRWYDWAMVEGMALAGEGGIKRAVAWTGVRVGGSKGWRGNR